MRVAIVVARFNDFITERLLEGATAALAEAGFDQPQVATELLTRLRESRACRAQSAHGRKRLQRLMPLLLAATFTWPYLLASFMDLSDQTPLTT